MSNYNFIDLFAGASGLSEGFVQAGYNPIAHIEMNEDACFTIRTRTAYHFLKENNYYKHYIKYLKKEITRETLYSYLPNELINNTLNIEIGDNNINDIFKKIKTFAKGEEIDFIIGGPPCQAYSMLGRHQEDIENDPRNKLYIQYGRFLKEFNPKFFVFENVPGLISAAGGYHLKNLKKYFRKLGYELDYKILNSGDFGVLQSRKRVIIIGWKKDIDFQYPDFEKIIHKNTTNDLFKDLKSLSPGEKYDVIEYTSRTNKYLKNSNIRNGLDFVTQHISRPHNAKDLEIYRLAIEKWNENTRLKYNELPEYLKSHKNEKSFLDRFKVVNGDGLSHTIVAHIAKDGHYYIHPDINQVRSISVREAARIQSFADDFFFEGSRTSAFKQIGNAVPPLMAYEIAKKMKINV